MINNKLTNPVPVPNNPKNQVHGTGTQRTKAFTLVELIVVITILAILGTIAFISLQGYSKDTRNSVRLSDLSNINKMLGIKIVTAGKVPIPDNYVEITASGITLNYQGKAGENVLPALGVSNGGKDPKDDTYYTYSTNTNLTKYQLLGFMEGDAIAGISETFAVSDLSERQVRIYGNELGIILDGTTNIPVTTGVDILNTATNYKISFGKNNIVEGTGSILFKAFYLNNKNYAYLDDDLLLFIGLENFTLSGSINIVKDFSKNGTNGECYNSGTLVNCGNLSGPQIANKGMYFDGIDDFIKIVGYDNKNKISTISTWINIEDAFGTKPIFEYSNGNSYYGFIMSAYRGNLKFFYSASNGGPIGATLTGTTDLQDNNRHLLTFTDDGTNMKIYVDGILEDSDVSPIPVWDTEMKLYIGANRPESLASSYFTEAILGDIIVYNRALSDSEIEALYNSTK